MTVVELHRYLVSNGRRFPLHARVSPAFDDPSAIEVTVPFPPSYDSRLVKYLKKHGWGARGFAYVYLKKKGPNSLHLSWFKVRSKEYYRVSSREEKDTFRGIGKQLLCLAIGVMARRLKNPATATLTLLAGGGACRTRQANRSLSEDECRRFLRRFPHTFDAMKKKKDTSLKSMRKMVCDIEQNLILVQYYEQYGLRVSDSTNGMSIKMEGDLRSVVGACMN
eukprot:jgi/Mesvir1/1512/Mv14495-RA.1